ncbi:beta-N-acetylhexosaminidase [Octadecabacter sp. R77987]|uniref:beta-N-acetylhexosaminidase n=1 Tax=Octadecabacter sp. R77987 TaxID=3093874 RepID=UPI00366E4605
MDYACELRGPELLCTITVDRDLARPLFCFSGMAPLTAIAGGKRIKGLGSYTEVALPDLYAGQPHQVTLQYAAGHKPANRAWHPIGPVLRVGTDVIKLPQTTEPGCRPQPLPDLGPFDGLPLIPQPTAWEPDGQTITVDGFAGDDPAFAAVAGLASRQGLTFDGDHLVTFETADLPEDAYTLHITPEVTTVQAASYGGRFYAGITLLTLLQHGALPCGTLHDTPRFSWRGQHLDTARHYYQPETVCDLLDLMALLKLNRFHWHFADDEAFRLEIDCLPALWQKTAFCGEGQLLPALFADGLVTGGSYSKGTARMIIAHAKALNIEVMPEIETPAHAIAITHVFPDTRDPADNGAEVSVQGYHGNALNPAQPKTWDVIGAIAAEVGALFPFNHLHLGCDELPEGTWMGSPLARDLMAREGLDNTHDLQGWTMERIAAQVVANGQRPCAWEEAAQGKNGGIGHNAILFSWTGQGPGVAAARAGYDVVMIPAQHTYFDMAHTDDPDDWGASWAAFVSLTDTIAWEPVPEPDIADKVIGVQGAFWSEFTTQDAQIWPMLMPRMLGLAVKAWQSDDLPAENLIRLARGHFLVPFTPKNAG